MKPLSFFARATGVVAFAHLYLGLRLLPDLPLGPWGLGAAVLALVASCLLIPLGFAARFFARPPLADRLAWVGFLAMGLFSSLFVLTVLRDAGLLVGAAVGAGWEAAFGRGSALAVPALALAATLAGVVNARRRARVVEVAVPLDGLPPALDGFTITQISDVHVGPTIKRGYLEAIVERVNALGSDLVVITGDLVDGTVEELAPHTEPLSRLRARHGVCFVTGNHEYYAGAHAWIRELRRLGLRVLLNEHVVLRHRGAALVVAGVTDYSAGYFDPAHRSDPAAALAGAPADAAARILLAHQPRSAARALEVGERGSEGGSENKGGNGNRSGAESGGQKGGETGGERSGERAGYDLQISGHTHGGQFLPWNFFVRFQQPFTAGLHRLGRMWIYISRGTGYWGPPVRLGAPSEITRLRLVQAQPVRQAQQGPAGAANAAPETALPSATG